MRSLLAASVLTLTFSYVHAEPVPDSIVEYKKVNDTTLKLHVFDPPGHQDSEERPAIVFFFGGGWNGGTPKQFYPQSEYLASRGMVAICADYRVRSRHNTTPKECVQDGKSAIRWIRRHASELGVDPNRLVAAGGSAGGQVAAATATAKGLDEPGEDTSISCRPNALALYNPVFDNGPTGFAHDRVKEYWEDFSPMHNISQQTPPTIVFLGTKDSLIPVSTAQEYKKRMDAAGGRCDLMLYKGERHGFFNKSKYAETTADLDSFLASLGYLDENVETSSVSSETDVGRDSRLKWWRDAKFGMFVHWGVYSVTGGQYKGQELPNSAEWMMNRGKIPIAEYEKYAERFNPTKFDATEFVALAKQAGMKYLVITAKHHDGFSMFDSRASDYNVVDATPFGRDIMKELAEACQAQGIRFGFYYSQAQDWHHPGGMGNNWDKSLKRVSNDDYVREKAVPEVQQLLTDYGPIGIFWWDTPRKMSQESFDSLHSLTELQPSVITNDRLGEEYPGDYKTFERNIPDQGPAGQDWEVCMPISGSWGYKRSDTAFKSPKTLIRNLIDIASKGGNYLLNVSPTGEGTLLPESVERLKVIGQWMKVNGESIYGTVASPLQNLDWGRCTAKAADNDTILYLHVFDWPTEGTLLVPGLKADVEQATLLDGSDAVECHPVDGGVELSLPMEAPDEYASVIKLRVLGAIEMEPRLPSPSSDGVLVLEAEQAYIHNNEGSPNARIRSHDDVPHIGYWTDSEAWVEWNVDIDKPGEYKVRGEVSVAEGPTRFSIGTPGNLEMAEVTSTGGYGKYVERDLGAITIERAGKSTIQLKPVSDKWNPMNVRRLILRRQ